jgi:hypothetical protein
MFSERCWSPLLSFSVGVAFLLVMLNSRPLFQILVPGRSLTA